MSEKDAKVGLLLRFGMERAKMIDKKMLSIKLGKLVRNPRSFAADIFTDRNVFDRVTARTFLFFLMMNEAWK